MVRIWKTLTGFDGTATRAWITPAGYVAVYLLLLLLSPVPYDGSAAIVVAGMRVGMSVAAIATRGERYLAFTFAVASAARLASTGTLEGVLSPRLVGAILSVLVGAWLLRWLARRLDSRMLHVQGLILVAGFVTLGMLAAVRATGGAATASVVVAYGVGILVAMPVTLEVMAGRWPSRATLLPTVIYGVLLTASNAFIVVAAPPQAKLVALALPMGLVIFAAARGGLAPASAALVNVTVFASMALRDGAPVGGDEPVSSMALLGAFAGITLLLGAHVDDLRRARAALEERESVLRSVFDGTPVQMGIVETTENDVLHVRANAAVARALGFEPGELDGRWSRSLGFEGEDAEAWLDRYRNARGKGAPVHFEYERVTPDGETRSRAATVCHVGEGENGRARYVYFIEDVTDRVRRMDERDRFFAVSQDLLCIADANGVPKRVNPAFESVLGWSREALESGPLLHYLHPDDVLATAAELDQLRQGESKVTFANRFRRKDGAYRWLLWTGTTVPGESSVYLAARDVTGQKETEESLRRAKEEAEAAARAKMQFLANMSHELRTPVNGILGFIELALDGELDAQARDYLERCRGSCDALLGVVNDVLDFSKIDAGALQLDAIGFDLTALVTDVTRIVELEAEEKGVAVATVFDPDLPERLSGDSGRLRQVLLNLVANAVKFTEKGWVRVTARLVELEDDAAVVRLEVADTGVGVPADKHEAIFQPFAQADGSTTRRYGGTGLGLAIASQLVEAMGGRLSLESEPGRGSLFYFTLPFVIDRSSKASERDASVPPSSDDAGPLHVLLAEDHPVNQLVASRLLEKLGHEVVTVGDGREAVRRFGEGHFDLVLMDVQMPEMDGLDAARTIRSIEKKVKIGETPIIALTALATASDREACVAAGMNGYLAKPILKASLLEALAAVSPRARSRASAKEENESDSRDAEHLVTEPTAR